MEPPGILGSQAEQRSSLRVPDEYFLADATDREPSVWLVPVRMIFASE
jgi:hypothetical protein